MTTSGENERDVDEELAELEVRAEERKADRAKLAKAQEVIDLKAKEELEEEHGADAIATVKLPRHVPDLPTRLFVLCPEAGAYKRYTDSINKATESKNAKALREAHEQFARTCWIYPLTKDGRDAVFKRFPGVLNTIGHAAAKLAEGVAEDEGKG